jgi:hypothetical protein
VVNPKFDLSGPDVVTLPLSSVEVRSGFINEAKCNCEADFANEFIGGGVLTGGNVQEETLFITRPELLISMLLCAKMEGTEDCLTSPIIS